jgi:hypothetical protein
MVTVQPRGRHYDRLVADVVLPDGKLLNHERGKRGYGRTRSQWSRGCGGSEIL